MTGSAGFSVFSARDMWLPPETRPRKMMIY